MSSRKKGAFPFKFDGGVKAPKDEEFERMARDIKPDDHVITPATLDELR